MRQVFSSQGFSSQGLSGNAEDEMAGVPSMGVGSWTERFKAMTEEERAAMRPGL